MNKYNEFIEQLNEYAPLSPTAKKLKKGIKSGKTTLKDIEKAFADRVINADEWNELEAEEGRING